MELLGAFGESQEAKRRALGGDIAYLESASESNLSIDAHVGCPGGCDLGCYSWSMVRPRPVRCG